MSSRGRTRSREGQSHQAPGLMRHGPVLIPLSGNHPVQLVELTSPPLELLENKVRVQAAEIEMLMAENQRLASTQGILREDLVTAQQEAQRLKAHLKSLQTESDIQVRILLDKIKKFEAEMRAAEGVKKDLEQAHKEARGLIAVRQELLAKIQQANQELKTARADAEMLQNLNAEYDSLMQEHHHLRATFEYEKGFNVEQVRQMVAMEQNLFAMAREVEKLRTEVMISEKNAHAPPHPHIEGFMNHPDPSYPLTQMQSNGPYVDSYGRPITTMGPRPG